MTTILESLNNLFMSTPTLELRPLDRKKYQIVHFELRKMSIAKNDRPEPRSHPDVANLFRRKFKNKV